MHDNSLHPTLPEAWRTAGTYVLLLRLPAPASICIGRLGLHLLVAGDYLYLGSALGPGGVAGRVGRHLRRNKRMHWHIDYLLLHATLQEVWARRGEERLECRWAGQMRQAGAATAVPGFGASDCRCAGHLVYWPAGCDPAACRGILGAGLL